MMEILITAIKVLIAYFALMFISTNLLGIVLRGFIKPYIFIDDERYLAEDITTLRSRIVTFFFSLLTVAYFYLLHKYFNIGIPLAAGLFMLVRIPDVIFEIKNGEKLTQYNMPKRKIDYVLNLINWGIIPLLWYFLS